VVFVEAKVVTWCYRYLNELVHFGEQMDCELSVKKALMMILSVERDGEEVEDVRMGCARMNRRQRRMKLLLFDPYEEGLDDIKYQYTYMVDKRNSFT
jgi:hypothetical protein